MTLERILAKLISFKTLSDDHAQNRVCHSWILDQLRGLPLHVKKYTDAGFPSFTASTRRTNKPKLALAAHTDVVIALSSMFKARVVGSRMYGRGALDMKFAVACYIKLFQELGNNLENYDLSLFITSDEETKGTHGTGHILRKGFRPEFVFLPDAGGGWEIEKSAKGSSAIVLTARGKTGHASRPWTGDNAIDKLYLALKKIEQLFPGEPCGKIDHLHRTWNIGVIRGGEFESVIPDLAEADINMRFVKESEQKKIMQKIRGIVAGQKDLSMRVTRELIPVNHDLNHQLTKRYIKIAMEHGAKIKQTVAHGATDAHFLAEKNIPVLIVAPSGGGHHSEQEWISLPEVRRFYKTLQDFVIEAASREK